MASPTILFGIITGGDGAIRKAVEGAAVVTGSTRMKTSSAHKMILKMISIAVMLKLGHVYENMMINLCPSNIKLRDRMIRILCEITHLPYEDCETLLVENGFSLRQALDAYGKTEE